MNSQRNKNPIRSALDELATEYLKAQRTDDDEKILKSLPDEFDEASETTDINARIGTNLRYIPVSHWRNLEVSPLSKFGDNRWSFTCYPHVESKGARMNFSGVNKAGISYDSPCNSHRVNILKALAFYQIPHFSYTYRATSYGALASRRGRLVSLFNMLCELDAFRNSDGPIPENNLDDIGSQKVKEYISSQDTAGKRWEVAFIVGAWQDLSRAKLLPECYSLNGDFVSKKEISEYRIAYDEGGIGYLPLKLDDYALVFNYCKNLVHDCAEDALWLAKNFTPSVTVNPVNSECEMVPPRSLSSDEAIRDLEAYRPYLLNGEPWWGIELESRNDGRTFVNAVRVYKSISLVFSAAVTLIFATTGMRRSEVCKLRAGCLEEDSDGFWLNYTVFKTSHASQGISRRIPVPDITAKAIKFLYELGESSRRYGQHDFLFSTLIRGAFFGKPPSIVFIERALNRVAEATGLDSGMHSHQFRKSLAMYVIYQDSRNIDLIAHLFAHKSLRMTLRYLLALPSVAEEIRKQLVINNIDILEEVISAASSGTIGGNAGIRIKNSINESPAYFSKLQDGGRESLVEYIDSLLDQGIVMLHRTNMAICMKTAITHEFTPCNGKNEDAHERLSANIWACSPNGCSFAVFTERHIERLENDVAFHRGLMKHPYISQNQIEFSKIKIVEARKRLREVRGA